MVYKCDNNGFCREKNLLIFFATRFWYIFLDFFVLFCFSISKVVGFRLFCQLLYFISYFLVCSIYLQNRHLIRMEGSVFFFR